MFRWNFAEAILSRWAIKRVCKFILKKKLGDFILGDIDIDQLEVQLTRGTIQLSDLAINVDYINQKLAGAAVVLKEGSIASLSIKIPWKLQNCQIELDELELVLAPFMGSKIQASNSCSESSSADKQQVECDSPDKNEPGICPESYGSVSLGIHEGVKTIAKIVKWLLTSFHVRLKNLIVAFDPCLEMDQNRLAVHKSLVLRIAETEFGTCLSEDADRNHISKSDCLLGMAKLTNFVKFRGAVIEVVKMADMDKSSCPQDSLQTLCNECSSSSSPLGYTTAILTGRSEGISGRMNVSIPWKNGSLDIHEVDAAVCFDPIELRLQPNTIEWIIIVWESLEYAGKAARNCAQFNMMDSSCLNSRFHSSSLRNSTMLGADLTNPSSRKVSEELPFDFNGESFSDDLIPRKHVIQDWVPLSFEEDQKELEEDYGASIDEFFECFDGLRSSQANSANSGLWNWTYSVFSAINVASNLASGSGQKLPEQHVETSLRATVAGVSLFLYFHDKEGNVSDQFFGSDRVDNKSCPLDHLRPLKSCTQNSLSSGQSLDSYASCFSSMAEPNLTGLKIDHLKAKSQDVVITFQIGSRKKDCKISVKDVKIDEYYQKNHVRMFGFFDNIDLFDQMLINRSLKQKVLDALPPFPVVIQEYDLETAIERNIENISENSFSQQELIKVGLMETSGDFSFHCVVSVADPSGSSLSSTSISLNFPPCVLWLHFHLIDSLLNLFRMVETCFKRSVDNRDFVVENSSRDIKFSPHDVKRSDSSIKTVPRADNVQGNFAFARTRIIICFPLQNMEDFRHLYLMDKFIILEHFPPLITEEVAEVSPRPLKQLGASNGSSSTPTFSLHFDVGTLDMYFTNSIPNDAIADQSSTFKLKEVSVVKILSLTNRTGDKLSEISIVWQNGPVTGPWMTSRAWRMASTHDRRSRNKVAGKDCEFYSVAAVEDIEEMCSDIRQELILSSGFLLCLGFASIQLNLHSHDYERLSCLLDIVMHGLSSGGSSKFGVSEEERILYKHDSSQATIVMDCDILDLHIVFDEVPNCSLSVQKELIGSWNGFRLIVEKFEIMSVLNIGDIRGTNFFRLIHGEGRLCGSILNVNDCTSSATHDVLLISCTNSVSRRGGGDGSNVLSFGSAGTTITYLRNPQLSRSHTSILIHCGTIIAPGGRLDWIGHICSFFSSPFEKESSSSDVNQSKLSSNCKTYEASFFLDLVDVSLCYEPHFKHDDAYVGCDDTEQFVGSLLAASSFSISNHAKSNSASSEYNIQLRDLGLLICQSSGLNNDYGSYDVNYLQKMGYAKVASACLLVAVVKIYSLRWEVKCSDSHVNFHTCHDTTHGLFRLIAQLQQLYAPDVEDALAHLQSRWNSVQQSLNTNGSDDALDNSRSSLSSDSGKELSRSDDNSQYIGLLDGIIENAFQSENPPNPNVIGQDTVDIINPNSSFAFVDALSSVKMSACNNGTEDCCSASKSGLDNIEIMSEREELLPPLIESFYFPEMMEPSLTAKDSPPQEVQRWTYDLPARADLDCGKVGWYIDSYPVIVDNHVPNSVQLDSHQHHEKTKFVPVDLDASAHCREKGKVLFKNIDVRWSMFAGSDWSKQMKSSTGKDGGISLELILSGLNILYAIFPEGEINVSKLSIDAQDLNLYDNSANAPWKMVIGHYNSKDHPRESYAKAFKLDLETVRPDPMTPLEDYRLYLELLPIRLHLDQSQINFLISFFGNGSSVEESPAISKDVDMSCMDEKMSKAYRNLPIVEEALLPFFQKCDVKPLVVCVDYVPRHMDLTSLRSGNYVELLNLVPWKGIDLQLKQVCAVGVYGWASLCETVVGQWLEDISHNQVHKLLKGLAPVRSLVSVAAGASKLVTLPVKSYRRDKKLLKGVQRGAIAFVKSISLEAVGLGVHLASGAHEILLQTEFILRNIPSNAPSPSDKNRIKKSANSNRPADAQEGIRQAYESLSDGFSRTARAILGTPITEYRRGASAGSALATAVRAAPAAAIAPVTASAHAMRCALLGMRNSLDPEHQKESMNKYLGSSRP